MNWNSTIGDLMTILEDTIKKRQDRFYAGARHSRELEEMKQRNELSKQELVNLGEENVERTKGAGDLAKQRLLNEATRYTADVGRENSARTNLTNFMIEQEKVKTEKNLGTPDAMKAWTAIATSIDSTPEEKSEAIKKILDFGQSSFPGAPAEAPVAPTALPTVPVGPAPDGIVGAKPASKGAESMTFGTDMGTRKKSKEEEWEEAKASYDRMAYGTKWNRNRSWLDKLLN